MSLEAFEPTRPPRRSALRAGSPSWWSTRTPSRAPIDRGQERTAGGCTHHPRGGEQRRRKRRSSCHRHLPSVKWMDQRIGLPSWWRRLFRARGSRTRGGSSVLRLIESRRRLRRPTVWEGNSTARVGMNGLRTAPANGVLRGMTARLSILRHRYRTLSRPIRVATTRETEAMESDWARCRENG